MSGASHGAAARDGVVNQVQAGRADETLHNGCQCRGVFPLGQAGHDRANALFDAHRDDPEFGYRFLAGEAETAAARKGWA